MSLADELRALADRVALLEAAQVPAPTPEPAPPAPVPEPPAPEPPPVQPPIQPAMNVPVLQSRPLNLAKVLYFRDFNGSRYTRNVPLLTLKPTRAQFDALVMSHLGGVPTQSLAAASYHLLVDGVRVATTTPYGDAGKLSKLRWTNVDFSAFADKRRHLLDIEPDSPTDETCHPWWVYISPDGTVLPEDDATTQTGSYGVSHNDGIAVWGTAPGEIDPPVFTMEQRSNFIHFSNPTLPAQMYRRNLVPYCEGDPPYLWTLPDGRKTTMQSQAYEWTGMLDAVPDVLLRDGPYGVGLLSGPTHLQIGRRGGVYFSDSWSIGHIDTKGAIRRMAGYRHTAAGMELVGDWSAVPEARRGFREIWGFAWLPQTVSADTLDTSRLIDRGDGVMEHPHTLPPTMLVSDSQKNRIVRLRFGPDSHETPVIVDEWATGLNDPWDNVSDDVLPLVYVSERQAGRVIALDAETGAYVRTVLQGPLGLATIGSSRKYKRNASLAEMREAPVVLPEGLFRVGRWLYIGSGVARQIVRVHLDTGAYEVRCRWDASDTTNQGLFCKFAVVDDDSFGPSHTIFMSLWDVATGGYPRAFLPDGTQWKYTQLGSTTRRRGLGGEWDGLGYSAAPAVRGGRLIAGGAKYGLAEITLGQPGDITVNDALYKQGKAEYEANGGRLRTGVDGVRQWKSVPLPWGQSAALDYYLTINGHAAG